MSRTAIQVEQLSKRYWLGEDLSGSLRETLSGAARRVTRRGSRPPREEVWPLRDVSLQVAEGDALGVIGRNGAGKSTLLKILSRITAPTSGVARMRGRVAALLEVGTGFHQELTGRENVYLNGAILGMSRRDMSRRFDEIVDFAGVARFIDTPVKRYSSGMYLRLAFSVAATVDPDVLLVDEVLAVGDAEFQAKCLGRMATAEREGRTVVFVSHNLDAITRLCPEAIWLEAGEIASQGPSVDVVEDYLSTQVARSAHNRLTEAAAGPVTLEEVRLTDAAGQPGQVWRREQPVTVELRFTLRTPVPGLDLAAFVTNTRGVEVVNEAWSDTADDRASAPGEYLARLTLPPLLNVGEYVVGVWIGTAYEVLFEDAIVCRFRLEGDPRDRPKRAVVLDLPWEVTRAPVERWRVTPASAR